MSATPTLLPPAPGAGQTRIAGWRKRLCAHASVCVCLAGPMCLLQLHHTLQPLFAEKLCTPCLGITEYYLECIVAGCPVGTAEGWVGQQSFMVEYSQRYPTASTHILTGHISRMSTELKIWVEHTPVGHEKALYFYSDQLFILVFISDLMIPSGALDPFPSLFTSKALLLFTRRNSRNPAYFPSLFICRQ